MEIALIAHDSKKELMVQFCIAYCGVLAKHNLCATKMTGRLISEATGLKIEHVLPGRQGGVQQMSSRIEYNEIDAVVYFHDPADEFDANDNSLIRKCDANNVPIATNIATAELIITAIDRGDLDWREIVNPNSEYNRRKREQGLK